jgi:hypothetical protein
MPHRDKKPPEQIRDEIIRNQKFSMASAMGNNTISQQKEKEAAAVPEVRQLESQLRNFIKSRLKDPSGALKSTLYLLVKDNHTLILENTEQPLLALIAMIENLLKDEPEFRAFVRDTDLEWGRICQEHPHFQKDDEDAGPDDEYTAESVEKGLRTFLNEISSQL